MFDYDLGFESLCCAVGSTSPPRIRVRTFHCAMRTNRLTKATTDTWFVLDHFCNSPTKRARCDDEQQVNQTVVGDAAPEQGDVAATKLQQQQTGASDRNPLGSATETTGKSGEEGEEGEGRDGEDNDGDYDSVQIESDTEEDGVIRVVHSLRLFPPNSTSVSKKPVVYEHYDELVIHDPTQAAYTRLMEGAADGLEKAMAAPVSTTPTG
jgi:hypothetical protein